MFPLRLTFWEVPMKEKKSVALYRNAIVIAACFLFIVSFFLAGCERKEQKSSSSSSSSQRSSSSSEISSISSADSSQEESYNPWEGNPVVIPKDAQPDTSILEKLQKAKALNQDVIGWLQIPGSGVDYPVMQAEDNDYYLTHNASGQTAKNGAIYAHYQNYFPSAYNLPANATLFGHNTLMQNDPMFMELLDFYDFAYAKEHRYLTLTFPDGATTYWKIFAVLDTLAEEEDFYYYNPAPSLEELQHIQQEAQIRSYYRYGLEVSEKDPVLSLSTCTYKYRNWLGLARTDVRFVVMARLVREEETLGASPLPIENPDWTEPDFD